MASMTSEERARVDNAIWLCADHATLIDRDEATYTIEALHRMKREHEKTCAHAVRSGSGPDWGWGAGLLAVGPDVVCTGEVEHVAADSWTLRLKHFLIGDVHKLISFIDGFTKAASNDKYILSNELGDGRVLSQAPNLTKRNDGYSLLCPVAPSFPRIDVHRLGGDLALHPETGDLYLDSKGGFARVSGLDFLPQKVQGLLSMQRRENVFAPAAGMRFFEYFEAFRGSPWLASLMMLDVIRQAAIPYNGDVLTGQCTPLRCVTRVCNVEALSETPEDNRLPVRLELDVQGLGRWQRDIEVYMPTREQMDERMRLLAGMPPLWATDS